MSPPLFNSLKLVTQLCRVRAKEQFRRVFSSSTCKREKSNELSTKILLNMSQQKSWEIFVRSCCFTRLVTANESVPDIKWDPVTEAQVPHDDNWTCQKREPYTSKLWKSCCQTSSTAGYKVTNIRDNFNAHQIAGTHVITFTTSIIKWIKNWLFPNRQTEDTFGRTLTHGSYAAMDQYQQWTTQIPIERKENFSRTRRRLKHWDLTPSPEIDAAPGVWWNCLQ